MSIEPMTSAHADAVLAIYQAGIEEGNATFKTSAPGSASSARGNASASTMAAGAMSSSSSAAARSCIPFPPGPAARDAR